MMMSMGGAEGGEAVVDVAGVEAELVGEGGGGGVVEGADGVGAGFEGEVKVADGPRDAAGLLDVAAGEFEQGFGKLVDDVDRLAGLMDGLAVMEGMVEVEAEVGPVFCLGPETPAGELFAFDGDGDDGFIGSRGMPQRMADEDHTDQNRKYRWAMGRTVAGLQVSFLPSALTV